MPPAALRARQRSAGGGLLLCKASASTFARLILHESLLLPLGNDDHAPHGPAAQVGCEEFGVSEVFSFNTTQAIEPSWVPYRIAMWADVGQTDNSSVTVEHMLESGAVVSVLIGDWTYSGACRARLLVCQPWSLYKQSVLLVWPQHAKSCGGLRADRGLDVRRHVMPGRLLLCLAAFQ